jgi:peroxiredoxin
VSACADFRRRRGAGATVLLVTIATTAGWIAAATEAPGSTEPLAQGAIAPVFETTGLDGGTLALDALRGRVVLLNFWGIACPPCRIEMPELEKIHRRYAGRGLAVVGIEEMHATPDEARRFAAAIGVRYPLALDPEERIGRLYRLEAHPTTVLIDRQGRVAWINAGYLRGDEREIDQALREALALPSHP